MAYLRLVLVALATLVVGFIELVRLPFYRVQFFTIRLARIHGRVVLWLAGATLKVRGIEHIRTGRSYIFAANHASYFDIPTVYAAIPADIRIMYKKELEKVPVFGWALRFGTTFIPVERGRSLEAAKSLEAAIDRIRGGASVILFPEGTRTPDGHIQPFKRGAFHLAIAAGVPVVPVTINGTYRILPKGTLRLGKGDISVVLSEPVQPPETDSREGQIQFMNEVRRRIIEQYEEQSP